MVSLNYKQQNHKNLNERCPILSPKSKKIADLRIKNEALEKTLKTVKRHSDQLFEEHDKVSDSYGNLLHRYNCVMDEMDSISQAYGDAIQKLPSDKMTMKKELQTLQQKYQIKSLELKDVWTELSHLRKTNVVRPEK